MAEFTISLSGERMKIKNRQEVWRAITGVIEEMLADLGNDPGEITAATMLNADLGISSVEAIHLMILLEDTLEMPLNFQELATRDGEYVTDLSAGELFEYICTSAGLPRENAEASR
jgi:acyl carrier protein